LGLAWYVAIEYKTHRTWHRCQLYQTAQIIYDFQAFLSAALCQSACLRCFGDTSLFTLLPGAFDNVDFKLLNLQHKNAIPNLVTVEVNIYKHVCKPDIKEKWSLKYVKSS
jgi:hypothetical protein